MFTLRRQPRGSSVILRRMVSIWAGDNPREALVSLSAPVMTRLPEDGEGAARARSVLLPG